MVPKFDNCYMSWSRIWDGECWPILKFVMFVQIIVELLQQHDHKLVRILLIAAQEHLHMLSDSTLEILGRQGLELTSPHLPNQNAQLFCDYSSTTKLAHCIDVIQVVILFEIDSKLYGSRKTLND